MPRINRPGNPGTLRDLFAQAAPAPRAALVVLTPAQRSALLAELSDAELVALDAELARDSLAWFVHAAWPILEPGTPLRWTWHLAAICQHLEAVSDGRVPQLLINVPPGTMKSLLACVFWPAWVWARRPEWRVIFASYSEALAVRDSVKTRAIVESDWYQERFVRGAWRLAGDMNSRAYFASTRQGFRAAVGVGGMSTGLRADAIVVDDPLSAPAAFSKAQRDEVLRWWDQGFANRLADPERGARVIIMQRLHEEDLSGHVLAAGGWEHLRLPMLYEPERRCSTSIGWADPRQAEGDLLFPAMFPREVVEAERRRLGEMGFAGQHQQRPAPAEGGMFQRGWWRFWRHAWQPEIPELAARTVVLPERFDRVAMSWDLSFKASAGSDLVAGGAWGGRGADRFLLDLVWKRMGFTETVQAIRAMAQRWPQAGEKLVEDAANGPAVVETLRREVPGVIAVTPEGGKASRAAATSPQVEAGNVFLPLHAEWRDRYVEEHAVFPVGAHDDAVDQQSQVLLRWAAPAPWSGIFAWARGEAERAGWRDPAAQVPTSGDASVVEAVQGHRPATSGPDPEFAARWRR